MAQRASRQFADPAAEPTSQLFGFLPHRNRVFAVHPKKAIEPSGAPQKYRYISESDWVI